MNDEMNVLGDRNEGQDAEPAEQSNEPAGLEVELTKARQEATDLLDKYRRSAAEFANYRKRQERERDQERARISMDVLRKFLPLVDDLARAMGSLPEELSELPWIQGVSLIHRKMEQLLQDFGVAPIEALGQPFDPYYHSALMQQPSSEHPAGTVCAEIQKGYLYGDQVLRPTLVAVSTGPNGAD